MLNENEVKVIEQSKTDDELGEYSSKIIDLLKDLNLAEKHKVLDVTLAGLQAEIKRIGGEIIEITEDET